MANNWYYAQNGEKQGPISSSELKRLASEGRLSPDDLVWREDMAEWRAAGSIKGMFPQTMTAKQPPNLPSLPKGSPATVPKSSRNKPLLVIGVAAGGLFMVMTLCCGVLGLIGGGDGSGSGTTRRSRDVAEAPPENVITITSSQLFAEYEANDIAADKKYKGKILEVSGTVENISRDILDNIYVTLETGQFEIFSIQCFFADRFEDQAAELRPGQYLTIRGRCDGKFGNVILKDSIIK